MIRWNVRSDSMWGSKVIKFRACFNYIWKQLLSTWLPRFLSLTHSLTLSLISHPLFSICSFFRAQLEKKNTRIKNRPTICFYCTLEFTVQMHSMRRASERKKERNTGVTYIRIKRAQFTNWWETFQLFQTTKTTWATNYSLNYTANANIKSHEEFEFEKQMFTFVRKKRILAKWITWYSCMSIQLH